MKPFTGVDYFDFDDLLNSEEKMVRDTVTDLDIERWNGSSVHYPNGLHHASVPSKPWTRSIGCST